MSRPGAPVVLAGVVAAVVLAIAQCGARTPLIVWEGDGDSLADGADADAARDARVDGLVELCEEAGADSGPCTGIACNVPDCGAGVHTILSAKVYDPAGKRPLYDTFVYVPNKALEPIASGPVCATCQAAASGQPIVWSVTDTGGRFTLTDPPVGTTIPIVMQIGKWRRKIAVPIQACTNNVLDDPNLFRLPRTSAEGDIPLIAFSSGCDKAQCFLQRTVGIDASEFTGPGGSGRVHVYQSPYLGETRIAGALGDPYELWGDLGAMSKYDILFNACECSPEPRTHDPKKHPYDNMKKYLEGGGRMFGTHYHYNWFSQPDGPLDFQKQAPWLEAPTLIPPPPFLIDTSHPRGKAYADWLQGIGVSAPYGSLTVADVRTDVGGLNGGQMGHGAYTNTTQWIFHPSNLTLYLSFNTPTTNPPGQQCGRAVFSDVHLSGEFIGTGAFPSYCGSNGHDTNEQALEFLFFDLASCVQDDTKPPRQPCAK